MSLDYILERFPRLPLSKVIDILLQVCSGLSYAHEQGIVHQDIKPANIFVQPNDHVKIVDFGLACSPETTATGLEGTIFYAAPEAINGESVDERADIYSLGLTAFEMITGQRPFPEHDLTKMMEPGLDKDVPDPRTLIPDLPDELCRFIQGTTQRDRDARYQSIPQALTDLELLARKMDIECHPRLGEQEKMMRLFLFYQNQHEQGLKRLLEKFRTELKEIGVELREAEFKEG
jgi:serine/threonine protein kinase